MCSEFTRSDRELPDPGKAGTDDGLVRGSHGRYREEPAHQEQGQVGLNRDKGLSQLRRREIKIWLLIC